MALTPNTINAEMEENTMLERDDVPILKSSYKTYRKALSKLIDDWLAGTIESKNPIELWQKYMIQKTNDNVNKNNIAETGNTAEHKHVYNELVRLNVLNHLDMVTSHGQWIKLTFDFLQKIGIQFSNNMLELILKHDRSKYEHNEVLGYAIMFGDGKGFKALDTLTDDEKNEWQMALNHHYEFNPHHPEFFYTKLSDGKLDKNKHMLYYNEDSVNGADYLDESLIDMLACVGERKMGNDETFSLSKWLDIDVSYLNRYSSVDRNYIEERLNQCRTVVKNFIEIEKYRECFKVYFGTQKLVQ
jgi:hypothetical protein